MASKDPQVSEVEKVWEEVLRSFGLQEVKVVASAPGGFVRTEVDDEQAIIGCPVGRRRCAFVGGSCEESDSCAYGVRRRN